MINVDPREIEKFSQLAHRWWDPESEFKPLHDINPLRLDHIDRMRGPARQARARRGLRRRHPREAMARAGREVTGIDLAEKPLKVAQLHLLESGREVDYRQDLGRGARAEHARQSFDVVTCMELLEHVPDPARTVRACAELAEAGRMASSSRRSTAIRKSYLFAVIGAEYVLQAAAARHARLREVHQAIRARARCAAIAICPSRHHRHDLQPAHPNLFARRRYGRELHSARAEVSAAVELMTRRPSTSRRSRPTRSRR